MDNTKISSVVAKKLLEVKKSFKTNKEKSEARKKKRVKTDPTVPSTKRRGPTGIDDTGNKRTQGGEAPTGEDYSVGI